MKFLKPVQWQAKYKVIQANQTKVDTTQFDTACQQFKTVCSQIGEFIGQSDFKGGFDQYEVFINSDAAKNDPARAALLASMWNGVNQSCKYFGSKIGLGQPEWWYKCWNIEKQTI